MTKETQDTQFTEEALARIQQSNQDKINGLVALANSLEQPVGIGMTELFTAQLGAIVNMLIPEDRGLEYMITVEHLLSEMINARLSQLRQLSLTSGTPSSTKGLYIPR